MSYDPPDYDAPEPAPPLQEDLLDALWSTSHGDAWQEMDPDATCLPEHLGTDSAPAPRVRSSAAPTMIPELMEDSLPSGGTAVPLPEDTSLDATSAPESAFSLDFGPMIGEGGLARVYRARQGSLARDVAVKVVRRQASRGPFLHESRITAALDHPNVLPVHDLVTLDDGAPALVMKEVEGQSWREHLDQVLDDDSFDLVNEIRTLLAVCQAVAFAHDRGVLHLDLKPGNVMVGAFGEVLVMDWGCSVLLDGDERWSAQPDLPRRSQIRRPFGTPTYMPPELARGDGERVGPASDVYLLGAILVELLSGMRPRRGVSAADIVKDAAEGIIRRPPEGAPAVLSELARRATQADPRLRPATVLEVRDQLQHWLDTREARRIVRDARRRLAACEARIAGLAVIRDHDIEPEEEVFEIIGAFQQARMLWPDAPDTAQGEARARRLLATRALVRGEAGLALAQARQLPEHDPDRAELFQRAEAIREARRKARRMVHVQRWALGVAVGLVLVVGAVGFVLVDQARTQAQRSAARAKEGLDEVMRLSDHERLAELLREEPALWPAVPDRAQAMQTWLARARRLIARRPAHQAALSELGPPLAGESLDVRWRRRILGELDAGLGELEQDLLPAVQGRLDQARTLHHDTIEAHASAWQDAARAVADDPRFPPDFELAPQLGLVPLGADPDSGLQAFAAALSGRVPEREPGEPIAPAEGQAIVLILVPGGRVPMGAAPADAAHIDPRAKPSEGPVHTVQLDPYLIAKHELTQDQWTRIMGHNPAAYPVGHEIGGHTVSPLHPVEQIRWEDAREALFRVGLDLPTEAQWERASRAGTTTVYWTGDTTGSLDGAANIADAWAAAHDGPESWRYERDLDDGHTVHAPVGSLRPNAFGLHDTAGNVWEWCGDRYAPYTAPTEPGTGARQAPDDAPRVFRGGGFRATSVHARSADRYSLYADDYRAYDVGVRAARRVE